MLKLRESSPLKSEIIKFDGFIPLSVQFNHPETQKLSWTCIFESLSLLEIWLNKNSGAIWEMTLVSLKTEHIILSEGTSFKFSDFEIQEGIPIFEVSHWPVFKSINEFNQLYKDLLLREEHKILLEMGNNHASICFKDRIIPSRYLKGNRVYFGIDSEDFLCRIDMIDLNTSEIDHLKKGLDQTGGIFTS